MADLTVGLASRYMPLFGPSTQDFGTMPLVTMPLVTMPLVAMPLVTINGLRAAAVRRLCVATQDILTIAPTFPMFFCAVVLVTRCVLPHTFVKDWECCAALPLVVVL